jgi:hypothetical protein
MGFIMAIPQDPRAAEPRAGGFLRGLRRFLRRCLIAALVCVVSFTGFSFVYNLATQDTVPYRRG